MPLAENVIGINDRMVLSTAMAHVKDGSATKVVRLFLGVEESNVTVLSGLDTLQPEQLQQMEELGRIYKVQ